MKFDQNLIHQIAFEKMGGQRIQAETAAAADPETSQTHTAHFVGADKLNIKLA